MLNFTSDYMEGAHPKILARLLDTNLEQTAGYGEDPYCESARNKIRSAICHPEAEIHFLVGGTQANETVISTLLRPYEGVIAASTAHIATHEAGAIEHGGHKVLTVNYHGAGGPGNSDSSDNYHDPRHRGKISAEGIRHICDDFAADANHEHEVFPGMVYLSQPTEYGTLYTKAELTAIHEVCAAYHLPLFLDGARLGYGLAAPGNDVSLSDIASLADVFTIGGTKVGALFGEAVVFPKPGLIPHFYTMIKQHGAMLAKGRLLGIQFDTLFTDGLYEEISANAIRTAMKLKEGLRAEGFEFYVDSPTNQQMVIITKEHAAKLSEQVAFGFMQSLDDSRIVIRFCTSWATKDEDVDRLLALLKSGPECQAPWSAS